VGPVVALLGDDRVGTLVDETLFLFCGTWGVFTFYLIVQDKRTYVLMAERMKMGESLAKVDPI
jgi:hypothetical protein